ncbi:VOC family protein [Streptomyces sp. NPDC059740]|uniref:VOC family protein n=1 Tax=Streptomyces sp. NPDC059740 TaxID=3346926 RepID=UPI00364FFAC0
MKNPLPLSGFIQIALVVDDMDEALDTWCRLLDVARPDVRVTAPQPNPNESYRGRTACYGLKFAVLECAERGFVIELHEPDDNPSTFKEFKDRHGPGVHHIGFEVGEARDAVVEELAALGHQPRTVGHYPGGSWTVIDTESVLGVNLNIKPRA